MLAEAPPSSPTRTQRRAQFGGFAHLLSRPREREVLELNYVYGRWGRNYPSPARDRVTLKRALDHLREQGAEIELPLAVWGVPATAVWLDDDTVSGVPCPVCGVLMPLSLPDGPQRASRRVRCDEYARDEDQQATHDAHAAEVAAQRRAGQRQRKLERAATMG